MLDEQQFRTACGAFPTGVTVVTFTKDDGRVQAVTISSFTSVSLDPPLVLFCIDRRSSVLAGLYEATHIGINILSSQHAALSSLFAREHLHLPSRPGWILEPDMPPLLSEALATFQCKVVNKVPAGDHDIVVAEVTSAIQAPGDPLVRYRGAFCSLLTDLAASDHRR